MKKRFTHFLAVFLSAVMALTLIPPVPGLAANVVDSGSLGGSVTYKLYDDGKLEISGTGATNDYGSSSSSCSPFYHNLDIKNVVIGNGVTTIGKYLFYHCYEIESLTIGAGVKTIREAAFYCADFKELTIPANVETIEDRAFRSNDKLEKITFENGSLTTIGQSAFAECEKLKSFVIPDSVTTLGDLVFASCSSLESVTLGSGIHELTYGLFKQCTALKSLAVPLNVTVINSTAFKLISSDVCNISDIFYAGDEAAWNAMAQGVQGISGATVYFNAVAGGYCGANGDGSNLSWILRPDGVLSITGTGAMADYSYKTVSSGVYITTAPWGEYDVTGLEIGGGVTTVGKEAFDGLTGIESVVLPTGVTTVGSDAFYGCTGIKRVVLPSGLTTLDSNAFYGCTGIKTVALPESITTINQNAFYNCTGITAACYAGTYSQWNNSVTVMSGNENLTNKLRYSASGYCGAEGDGTNLVWTLDGDGLLTISGTGAMTDYTGDSSTSVPTPFYSDSRIKSVVIENGVTNVGNHLFQQCGKIESVSLAGSVTKIGEWAFNWCEALKGITIPDSVTVIDKGAFQDCKALEQVTLGNGVTTIGPQAFFSCRSLKSIEIPDSVTSIGHNLFAYCSALEYVVLGNGLTSLPNSIFRTTGTTKYIVIPASITEMDTYAFKESNFKHVFYGGDESVWTELTRGVGNISNATVHYNAVGGGFCGADEGGENLIWTVSNENVLSITGTGDMQDYDLKAISSGTYRTDAPWGEYSIASIKIGKGVTSIGESAFGGLTLVTSAEIPWGLRSIGESAFYTCARLAGINLPVSVTSIGSGAFYRCVRLRTAYYMGNQAQWGNVTVGDYNSSLIDKLLIGVYGYCGADGDNLIYRFDNGTLTISGTGDMADYDYMDDQPWYDQDIETVIVKSGVTSVGIGAFAQCDTIKNVIIEEGVTSIGDGAFHYCRSLESVSLPPTLTYLGEVAFENCDSLTSVTIPNGVTELLCEVFCDCISLKTVTIPASVSKIDPSAFNSCDDIKAVFFTGSESEWNGIYNDSEELLAAPVFYNVVAGGFCGANPDAESLVWTVNSDGVLTVSGSGAMRNYNCVEAGPADWLTTAPWAELEFTSVVINDGVTRIGDNAFVGCVGITQASLADGVEIIGEDAFWRCTALKSVNIPGSVTQIMKGAFSETAITGITIPDGVTIIPATAFDRCKELKSVTMTSSVKYINGNAFGSCSALTDVWFYGTEEQWGEIEIGVNNDSLNGARIHFITASGECGEGTDALLWFVDGSGVLTISGEGKMRDYALSGGRTSAPWGDIALTAVVIEEGVSDVGKNAFAGTAVKYVQLPFSLGSVGEGAFNGCSSLKAVFYADDSTEFSSISVGSSNAPLQNAKFYYEAVAGGFCGGEGDGTNLVWMLDNYRCLIIDGEGKMADSDRAKPKWLTAGTVDDIVIMPGVTGIGKCAFYSSGASGVEIPDSVTSIGEAAFMGCSSLAEITIPDGVKTVGVEAFNSCENLVCVTVGTGLTSVAASAFDGCDALKAVFYRGPESRWNDVTKGANNDPLINADVYFNVVAGGFCGGEGDGTNLVWILDPDGIFTVSGSGAMRDYDETNTGLRYITLAPWADLDNFEVVIGDGVTSIGDCAFEGCKVTQITLTNSVADIGNSAFWDCYELTDVWYYGTETEWDNIYFYSYNDYLTGANIHFIVAGGECGAGDDKLTWHLGSDGALKITGNGKMEDYTVSGGKTTAPWGDKAVSSVSVGEGVTGIGKNAFAGTGVEAAKLPVSLASVGEGAFDGCASFETVFYAGSESDFNGVSVGSRNEPLKNAAFYYNCSDSGVCGDGLIWTLCDGVLTVSGTGEMWDYGYIDLGSSYLTDAPWGGLDVSSVVISQGVTYVGTYAFLGMPGLTGADIQNGVTEIGDYAFYACPLLKSVTLPDSLTDVGQYAFAFSGALENVVLPEGLETIGEAAFARTGITSVTVPGGVENIGKFAFNSCEKLTSAVICPGVTSIGWAAFGYCSELKDVTIPDTVTMIDVYGFSDCVKLENVFYSADQSKWNAIDIKSDNEPLLNAKIHFNSDGDHAWDAGTVTKAATCKEAGVKTYTCSVCGTTKTETIAKTTDHKYDSGTVTKAATCKETGVKTYTCTVCGATKTETIAKTTDHKYDSGKVTKAATCKDTGVKTYTCTVCGATKTETIAKTTDHKYDSGKVTKAATCKETGVKTYTCTVCGATKTETIAKTTDHKYDSGKVTKAATCKETGVKTYTCTVCGATKTETIAKTTDHKYDSGKVTKAATCKETGVKTYTCTVCGATKTETIAKTTDHKYDSGKVTKAATCKETGVKTYTCTVCGAKKTETIAKTTDHKYDSGKVTKAATCKETGVKTYTCTVCGATRTETIAKNANNHADYGTEIKNAKAATEHSAGYTGDTVCKGCGAVITKGSETEKLAPSRINGEKIKETDDLLAALPGQTVGGALALAPGAKLLGRDGKEAAGERLLATGMTLVKSDGKKLNVIIMGDVDGDGEIKAADARYALRAAVGLDDTAEGLDFSSPANPCFIAADITCDGNILAEDARYILRGAVGLDNINEWFEKITG